MINHIQPKTIEKKLERILMRVQKPGRYVGGEYNQVVKDWNSVRTHFALAFPDIYDIGLPNLGIAILYDQINQRNDIVAERVYCPWEDMESLMIQEQIPLFSLESKHSVSDFDILGISLPYESLYTNALNLMHLAGIPLLASERTEEHPLVIAGGQAVFNPEPMADFIDVFAIGEGEDIIHDVIDTYQVWKDTGSPKQRLLEQLAKISGIYVPSFYTPSYNVDGTLADFIPNRPGVPEKVTKRITAHLPPPPTNFLVPNIDVVHNRIPIEIMRGCTRGCRFCHAGMVNRPVRERPVDEVVSSIQASLDNTGFEEIALLSLSSSDYTHIIKLIDKIQQQFLDTHLKISLPSLRIDTFSIELMEKISMSRPGGFTLAPEAATEQMRNTINKPISNEMLLNTTREIYRRGWKTIKLYFMIGHPNETLEDVQAIANLCKDVLYEGRRIIGRKAELHAGVSTFVPKAHTPFQWVSCDKVEQIQAKQQLLRKELRAPGLKLNWTNPLESMFEAWCSRGDRRLGSVILQAWKNGAKFDAWQDRFNPDYWNRAFEQTGLSSEFYTHRERNENELFPWDHIQTGVSKSFLIREYHRSLDQELLPYCAEQCAACGILTTFADLRKNNPGSYWKCPELTK